MNVRDERAIRDDISDRLTHGSGFDTRHVRVQVNGGEVTLDGSVENQHAMRRAEDIADQVSGVQHVQNNLHVDDSRSTSRSGASTATTQQAGTSRSTVASGIGVMPANTGIDAAGNATSAGDSPD